MSTAPDAAAFASIRQQLQEVYDILTLVEETHPRKHKRHSPTAVKARIHAMITEIDVFCTRAAFDAPSFPHILDRVLALADYDALMALRGVNKELNAKADARLFAHVALISPSSSTPLVNKIKHRVGIAVGPGGFVLCTPDSANFLPHLPSSTLSPERVALIRAVDYYGPRPSPHVQEAISALRDVEVWRSEAPFAADADDGAPLLTRGVAVANFPIMTEEDTTFTVRVPPDSTAVVHLTWPDRAVGRHETPVIVDLFASPGSDAYIVVEKPDPDQQLPLATLRAELGFYLGAGIAEAFPRGTTNPPRVTMVGLEGLYPGVDAGTTAAFTQRCLQQLASYIFERYSVEVAQHVCAMTLDEWEAAWRSREWERLATNPHLPYTSNEVSSGFW
ncbi:hypothetical protein CspeluHIS016_0107390 [Cutaneotrichosporon spelunceum]|uniref:Uncharacterized protein n=1 Tax=Cutaneotrichosporon spelunceum TaxID=1672016 RepID=A0AAD3TP53_9TREE|nr:hypothetical protein CspeluHIS016_0107390 [Cutaneotrichosporon spelunceum]